MHEKGRENEEGSVIVSTIIRTAGARATPALSTLLILSAVGNRGKKGSIMIIGHTDCGLQSVGDGEIRRILAESIEGVEGSHAESVVGLEGIEFGSFRRFVLLLWIFLV
ncbi:hypothetical protein HYALB_00010623 [Hymenoscyphus albidus]|uniref:Carbonic anhydrase n=1 Tax=Hymenoscyphus albidus TaxID=595503 RepID=A0A9N9Q4E5_9HELO|nr:hypothetical protein HYALB_00010623 [Hymenoscyphus albidus]